MVKNLTKTAVTVLTVALVVSMVATAPAQVGTAYVEYWSGIGGGNVSDLTGNPAYPNSPSGFYQITGPVLEARTNWADNYGQRVVGYFLPPQTGTYIFWCATDDASTLSISTDTNPANLVEVCETRGWAGVRDWGNANVTTGSVSLTLGNKYYFQILHKEGGGGDNLAVAWRRPDAVFEGPIPMANVEGIQPTYGVGTVGRDLPGNLTDGSVIPVGLPTAYTLRLDGTAFTADTFTATDTLPAGLTYVSSVVTTGAVVVTGQQVVWSGNFRGVPAVETAQITVTAAAAGCYGMFTTQNTALYDVGVSAGTIKSIYPFDRSRGRTDNDQGVFNQPAPQELPDDYWWNTQNLGLAASGVSWIDADTGVENMYPGKTAFLGGGRYVMRGSGNQFWNLGDDGHHLYLLVIGDFELSARVRTHPYPVDREQREGILARNVNLHPDPILVGGMAWNKDNNSLGQIRRPTQGANINSSARPNLAGRAAQLGDSWFRLRRVGTQTTLTLLAAPWTSTVAQAYVPPGHQQIPLNPVVALGLFACGAPESAGEQGIWEVEFTSVSLAATPYVIPIQAARSYSTATYTPGTPVTVSLNLTRVASVPSTVTVVENVPAGYGSRVSAISGGGVLTGDQIVWRLPSFVASTALTYNLNPRWQNHMPLYWVGATWEAAADGYGQAIADSALVARGTFVVQQGILPTASYAGCEDNHIIFYQTNNNTGQNAMFEEGDWYGTQSGYGFGNTDHKKGLIQFQGLDAIAPSIPFVPTAIRLGLYNFDERRADYRNAHNTNVRRVLKPWWEGAGRGTDGQAAMFSEATWNSVAHLQVPWELPGVMGNSDAGNIDAVANMGANWPEWVWWDVTASVLDMVSSPANNHGWKVSQDMVRGLDDATSPANLYVQGAYGFRSSEDGNRATRPMLMAVNAAQLYDPNTIGAITRTAAPASYTWGVAFTVTLNVAHLANSASIQIRENLPTGLAAADISAITGGGAIVGNQIVWNITPWAAPGVTVTYNVTVPQSYLAALDYAFAPVLFSGGQVEDAGATIVPIPPSSVAHAGVYTFQDGLLPGAAYDGCQDAQIITYRKDVNISGGPGGDPRVEQGDWGGGLGDHKKVLIQFDVSSIPAAEVGNIASAHLMLYAIHRRNNGGAANNDHFVTPWTILKAWNEGDGPYADGDPGRGLNGALANEVTWNNANVGADTGTTVPWQIPGAMGVADVGTSEPSTWWNVSKFATQNLGEWLVLDVTNSVKSMVTTPASNHGWKVCQDKLVGVPDDTPGNEYVHGAYAFLASEAVGDQAVLRPILVVRTTAAVPVEVSKFIVW